MKQEIKKGYEWYRTLTKKQQKQWRKNLLKYCKNNLKHFYNILNRSDSLKDFMYNSFIFRDTPQGHDYWRNIANKNK